MHKHFSLTEKKGLAFNSRCKKWW